MENGKEKAGHLTMPRVLSMRSLTVEDSLVIELQFQ